MATEQEAITSPPNEQLREGASRMGRRERAYAAELALRAGYPLVRSTWGYVETTDQVVVEVPRYGVTWGIPRSGADETLARIEERWGAERRRQIEDGIA